jgi:hypothetical protein
VHALALVFGLNRHGAAFIHRHRAVIHRGHHLVHLRQFHGRSPWVVVINISGRQVLTSRAIIFGTGLSRSTFHAKSKPAHYRAGCQCKDQGGRPDSRQPTPIKRHAAADQHHRAQYQKSPPREPNRQRG